MRRSHVSGYYDQGFKSRGNRTGAGPISPFLNSPTPEDAKPKYSGDSGGTGPETSQKPGSHFPVRFNVKKRKIGYKTRETKKIK